MAEFSKLVITNNGQALLAKMIAGSGNIEFSKVSTSSAAYTDAQLEGLDSLSDVKQTSLISKVTRTNEVAIKVEAAFTNTELTVGYYMKALGLYAVDPDDGEILYAVAREISGNCYMPAYNGITVSGAYVQLVTTVGNAENVSLEVTPGAVATIGDIQELQKQIADLEAATVPVTRKVNGKALKSDISLTAADVKALPISGGTLTGNLTIKGDGNYGMKINLGDGDYVHISEPKEDCMEIKAKKVNFVISSTDADSVAINGKPLVGKSLAGKSVQPENGTTVTAREGAEIFNDYRSRIYDGEGNKQQGNVASGSYSHAEGQLTTASGTASHAEGSGTIASGYSSHAEGSQNKVFGDYSHVEGFKNKVIGHFTRVGGKNCRSNGSCAEVIGDGCVNRIGEASNVTGTRCHIIDKSQIFSVESIENTDSNTSILKLKAFQRYNSEIGLPEYSFETAFSKLQIDAEIFCADHQYINTYSYNKIVSIDTDNFTITVSPSITFEKLYYILNLEGTYTYIYSAHAEGQNCICTANGAHAEGKDVFVLGNYAHAEGYDTTASGNYGSHAEGSRVSASGMFGSHAEGQLTTASGTASHAEGSGTIASGYSSHAGGSYTKASAENQTAIGKYNVASTSASSKLIIGKGTSDTARANCFRVTDTGVYASGSYNSSGADYAEFFEWLDSNPEQEDRAGLFVTLEGEKIRLAQPDDDFILGIVSGEPSVCGDVYDDQWKGMYLYDIYGRPLWEDVEVPDKTIEGPNPENPDETITRVIIPAHTEHRQKLNPDYDNTQPYVPRSERPEWDAVGMLGKLVVRDDGTCRVNECCAVGENGTATYSGARTKYRVMARLDENHVRVLIL